MASRALNGLEQAEARRVFGASLMCGRIEISDSLGLGDRPWTSAGLWTYTIHLGPRGYTNALTMDMKSTFIHELTHVWQGQNSTFGFGFMVNSVCAQVKSLVTNLNTSGAYRYVLGKEWDDYNCEQQASIVEDWYDSGMNPGDPRFRHIRDHILRGKN